MTVNTATITLDWKKTLRQSADPLLSFRVLVQLLPPWKTAPAKRDAEVVYKVCVVHFVLDDRVGGGVGPMMA
jgi:hypothetical protein